MAIEIGDFAVALIKIVTARLEQIELIESHEEQEKEIDILNDKMSMYCMLANCGLNCELAGCPPKNTPPENVFDRMGLYMMEHGK